MNYPIRTMICMGLYKHILYNESQNFTVYEHYAKILSTWKLIFIDLFDGETDPRIILFLMPTIAQTKIIFIKYQVHQILFFANSMLFRQYEKTEWITITNPFCKIVIGLYNIKNGSVTNICLLITIKSNFFVLWLKIIISFFFMALPLFSL
jgi:hypothetical protein